MSPAEGERRLNSAIAPRPGPVSASLRRPIVLPRETRQLVEPFGGGSGVHGAAREVEPLAEVDRVPGGGDRAGGVQEHGVASPTVCTCQHVANCAGVLVGRPAAKVVGTGTLDAQVVRIDRPLVHVALDDL